MVKTRFLSLFNRGVFSCLMICSLAALAGCGVLRRSERADAEALRLAKGRLGAQASLVRTAGSVVAVYSDQETAGLYEVEIPASDHFPTAAPAAKLIDRIDMAPPLASTFGEHAVIAHGDTVTVMYLARATEDRLILKVASHDQGAAGWTLDSLEPAGHPVAILPAGSDHLDLFWAAGPLLRVTYPGTGSVDSLADPFIPADRAGTFGPGLYGGYAPDTGTGHAPGQRGVTVYDSVSHALLLFRWNGFSYDKSQIDGAGPVHSSLLLSDGRLAVLSWDPSTRRLEMLIQGQNPSRTSRVLVTVSEGTSTVALLPSVFAADQTSNDGSPVARADDRIDKFLYLYDEARSAGGGRLRHELSLLAPGSGWGLRGYHKYVLQAGEDPIESFSALEDSGWLYVLVHQGDLKVLKWKLPA
jgi:hypothetical protein